LELKNVLFSSEFIALRPESKNEALLLWSIFNSTVGKLLLKEIFQQDRLSHPLEIQDIASALLRSKVPSQSNFPSISFETLDDLVASQSHELSVFEDKRRSWFRKKSLNEAVDWFYLMTVDDLSSWMNERPIIDLLDEIILGRHRQLDEQSVTGELVPLVNIKFVNL
jgi:hypothetical protein